MEARKAQMEVGETRDRDTRGTGAAKSVREKQRHNDQNYPTNSNTSSSRTQTTSTTIKA